MLKGIDPVISPELLKIIMEMGHGDELVIDTRLRRKSITLNGESCFTFERDSTFFSLPKGVSALSVTCDSGAEFAECEIEYVPAYYGM